jgi:nitronate monooxygenase
MHWNCGQDTIETRLTRELGLRHPFVSAGMGFIAHPALAAAVTNAGGLGVLGASPDPAPSLPVMAAELRSLTSGPWGVDLICAMTGLGPACTDEHIEACVSLQVPLVVFHHDPPSRAWVDRLDAAGIPVWMQVSSPELAAAAAELGVAGLVVQGAEAGGHSRATTPLHVLLGLVRERHPGQLLLAAGGITDGADVAAAIRAGADGVWVGTRLVASTEAAAHPEYQRRLVEARSRPVTTTAFGPEWPDQRYRLLPTGTVAEWAGREDQIPGPPPAPAVIGHTTLFPHSAAMPYDMPKFSAIPPSADTAGDWDEMAYPAGDGVDRIHDVQPAAQIITGMMTEAHALLSGQMETAS